MNPLEFARVPTRRNESCAGFVARWLAALGVARTPNRREIIAAWRQHGIAQGVAHWCDLIGLEPCEPETNAIALAEQDGGDLILGVLTEDGWFVTRSFGVVARLKPRIVACWRIPKRSGNV